MSPGSSQTLLRARSQGYWGVYQSLQGISGSFMEGWGQEPSQTVGGSVEGRSLFMVLKCPPNPSVKDVWFS